MAVDTATFRDVLGQWPSGVTVVTTLADGTWHGMTASSFSSVSADPPLVSVALLKKLYTHELFQTSGVFGVNILAKDQTEIGKRFAGMNPEITDRFDGLDVTTAETGVPLLAAVGRVARLQGPAHVRRRRPHDLRRRGHGRRGHAPDRPAALPLAQLGPVRRSAARVGDRARLRPARRARRTRHHRRRCAARGVRGRTDRTRRRTTSRVRPDRPRRPSPTPSPPSTTRPATTSARCASPMLDAFAPDDHDAVLDAIERPSSARAPTEVVLDDTGAAANPLTIRNRLTDAVARTRPAVGDRAAARPRRPRHGQRAHRAQERRAQLRRDARRHRRNARRRGPALPVRSCSRSPPTSTATPCCTPPPSSRRPGASRSRAAPATSPTPAADLSPTSANPHQRRTPP